MHQLTSRVTKLPLIVLFASLALLVSACGGGDAAPTPEAEGEPAIDTAAATARAAKVAGTIETKYFTTVLPEGWEVMADDIDSMGLMTISEKGSGGQQAVYVKFEGGGSFSGDPLKIIEKFAGSYNGTAAETVQRNGIDWARTRYTYNNLEQSLNVTAHNGYKITFTVMGEDYDSAPGVKAIFDRLTLK